MSAGATGRESRTVRRWGVLIALLAGVFFTNAVNAGVEIDESQVYYGNATAYKKVGEIDCNQVFHAISEYRTIREEGLKEGVRYDLLLVRANEKFRKALKLAHKRKGYDLIVEAGSITGSESTVPDITDLVIDLLPE